MKVTLNWLKQYVDFNWSPEELSERLTMLGIEVEGVQKVAGAFEGVGVAEVIHRDKHPNAGKLSLCRVPDGKGERQILRGAQNFQAGDKVPLVLPGATLPTKPGEPPFTIKVGKIRGVESHGMMCSPQELGLPDQIDGLLILPPDARVGQSFAEHLGRTAGDVVYDLEVTPNRPDLNSLIGIAREISALTGNPLKLPEIKLPAPANEADNRVDALCAVRLEDAELCPRYTARVIRGVKIGPSPEWLRAALEKVGLRAINNVVDVTNYVMLETGQPLHAFDYHLVAKAADGKPTIVVRRANAGEKFITLDGQEHQLQADSLLIADEQKGIALAGVMGGKNSEINEQTADVLLESAYFKPTNIRRTSKILALRTDASYRYERGADISICDWASQRAVQLILETAGGRLAEGVVDAYPAPVTPRTITLRPEKVTQLLGVTVSREEIECQLSSLGLKIAQRVPQSLDAPAPVPAPPLTFRIPTFRVDLKQEIDLIEEVARLYGIDKIPSTPPRGAIGSHPYDAIHDVLAEARRLLTGLGLNEAQGQTLVALEECWGVDPAQCVKLANPLSSDMNTLRPSLLPGLLHALRHNLNHKNGDVALFEVGRVFALANGATREERRVAIAITGQRLPAFWSGAERAAKADLYDLKGMIEEFLEQFGLKAITYTKRPDRSIQQFEEPSQTRDKAKGILLNQGLFLESAQVMIGGKLPVGELGQLLPALAKRYDLRDAVLLAEFRLDELLARRNPGKAFKPLPAFPTVRRDLAMLVPETVAHQDVLNAVRQAKPQNLESVDLFDVFRGKHVPAGQKSVAYAFTYRHNERTLTDNEINATQDKLVAHLKQTLGAVVRE